MNNVLYIEDDEDIAGAVKILLSQHGLSVDVALNGFEGINKATSKSYDVILIDIILPDINGWEVYDRIGSTVNSKFIFISVLPLTAEHRHILKNPDVYDYIEKPYKKDDLIRVIKGLASG